MVVATCWAILHLLHPLIITVVEVAMVAEAVRVLFRTVYSISAPGLLPKRFLSRGLKKDTTGSQNPFRGASSSGPFLEMRETFACTLPYRGPQQILWNTKIYPSIVVSNSSRPDASTVSSKSVRENPPLKKSSNRTAAHFFSLSVYMALGFSDRNHFD